MRAKMDWLRLESRMREALRNYRKDVVENTTTPTSAEATLFLVDEILGFETGRGYELDGLPADMSKVNESSKS